MSTILALDFGTTTGWALYRNHRSTSGYQKFQRKKGRKTKPDDHEGEVLRQFMLWLRKTMGDAQPDLVVFEQPQMMKSAAAVNTLFGMRGICMAMCAHYAYPFMSVAPPTLKKFATGSGRAQKPDMIKACQEKLDPEILDDNQCDARWLLEVAITRQTGIGPSDLKLS